MSFLDRIDQVNDSEQQAGIEKMLEADTERQRVLVTRKQIVTDAVKAFAISNGTTCQEVPSGKPGRYFLVGDLVFLVLEQAFLDRNLAAGTAPHLVRWQHFVYLVGVDRTMRVINFKIGVLQLINFEGVRRTVNKNPGCTFRQHDVLPFIFQV